MIVGQKTRDLVVLSNAIQVWATEIDFYNGILTNQYQNLVRDIPSDEIAFSPSSWYSYQSTSPFVVYRKVESSYSRSLPITPSYIDLLDGYSLDPRTMPDGKITLKPTESTAVRISYFRKNHLESHPLFKSIDWVANTTQLTKDVDYRLDLSGIVLGTLSVNSSDILTQILNYPITANDYPRSRYLEQNLDPLFAEWNSLFTVAMSATPTLTGTIVGQVDKTYTGVTILRKSAANNDVWNNTDLSANIDINFDDTHPMFELDNDRAYNWHVAPQTEGIGSLTMDSPRTIETNDRVTKVWKALGQDTYATNNLNPDNDRVTNIGYLTENIARILGLRLDANGNIDRAAEKAKYLPATLNQPTLGEKDADGKYHNYDLTCWGHRGRMMPYLPTTYTADGKATKLMDVFHDLPQMVEAVLRQIDAVLSIQHGSEIRYKGLDGTIRAYPNQLAMGIETLTLLERINNSTQKTLNTSLVMGNELRGMMSGIGYPVEQRYLQLKDGSSGVSLSLPYFGHQKNKPSIAQTLTTVMVNQAIVNGVLMPKKQPPRSKLLNPFTKYLPKE